MTKDELIELVKQDHKAQEEFYCKHGPCKRVQEDHYTEGVSVVGMNVDLLVDWLDAKDYIEAYELWGSLPAEDKREVWEASGFHFGIYGYDDDEADFYWKKRS